MENRVINENIMRCNIENLLENWSSFAEKDEYIRQDNEDMKYLEYRYECLNLPHVVKRVADDYIACIKTRDERFADLAYAAGIRDGLALVKKLGILVGNTEGFLPAK